MKTILSKMAKAKAAVKSNKMKKEGRNKYSEYDYFTPSQVEKLVDDACTELGLLAHFDLIRNELGITGELTVYDVESGESLVWKMASAIPEIKATNIAQQLGGAMTYTERYIKMTAFGIVDNSMDFDTSEATKRTAEESKPKVASIPSPVAPAAATAAKTIPASKTAPVKSTAPPVKPSAPESETTLAFSEEFIDKAITEMLTASTYDVINSVWKKYAVLNKTKEFIEACQIAQSKLKR